MYVVELGAEGRGSAGFFLREEEEATDVEDRDGYANAVRPEASHALFPCEDACSLSSVSPLDMGQGVGRGGGGDGGLELSGRGGDGAGLAA